MALTGRTAERFESSLRGSAPVGELAPLVAVARTAAEAGRRLPGPDPAFVTALGDRLRQEMAEVPSGRPAGAPAGTPGRAPTPRVVVVGARTPRRVAVAVAALALTAVLLGVASRGALPGSPLYLVRGWLDAVAVQVSGSQYDRGMTELGQAREHISDAAELLDQEQVSASHVSQAFTDAASSLRAAQRDLRADYAANHRPRSLLALTQFVDRERPRVSAMRPDVPPATQPAYRELLALLDLVSTSSGQALQTCGAPCGQAVPALPTTVATGGTTVPSAPGSTPSTAGELLPSVSASVGGDGASVGASVGSGGGGVSLGTDGASVGVPGLPLGSSSASLTVPLAPLTSLLSPSLSP